VTEPAGRTAVRHHAILVRSQTKDVVECACGFYNHFHRWSWAGHGKARCAQCRGWINYRTLHVTPSK